MYILPMSASRLIRGLVILCLAVTAAVTATIVGHPGKAHAAVPDKFAFVLYYGGTVVPSGTLPAATTVAASPPGQYKVTWPGAAAKLGVVHVTAISQVPHWCQVNGFGISGSDEVAAISCYKVGGGLDDAGFSAIFDSSTGTSGGPGSFGYVDAQASGALTAQYNSVGAPNTVTHTGTGVWKVNFAALPTSGDISGSWQVTAVNKPTVPARCKVLSWTTGTGGPTAVVNCYNAAGSFFDTEFTLTFQFQRSLYGPALPPKYFGYLWNQPVGGPAATNYNSTAAVNTLSAGPLAVVTFPNLIATPDDVQVSGSGQSTDFCELDQPWTHSSATIVKDVTCYTNAGAHSASGFLISDNAAS